MVHVALQHVGSSGGEGGGEEKAGGFALRPV